MSNVLKITNKPTRFSGLTAAEEERLYCLIEECGEVVQAATKILRHGYESCHPERPWSNNRVELADEIGHIEAIAWLMRDRGDVLSSHIVDGKYQKERKLHRYLHHHCKCGQPAVVWDANGLPMCQECKGGIE